MAVDIYKIDFNNESDIYLKLYTMLPKQGCIELQRDEAYKCHSWHQHVNDETLLIIDGSLTFEYEDVSIICKSGDVIHLPSMTKHQSTASSYGCIYAIANDIIEF